MTAIGPCAILLAAGLSRRMGALNKLLLDIDGEPMLRRVAKAIRAARVDHLLVVVGHQADQARAALAGIDLATIENRDYASGQTASVRCGLAAAPAAAGYLLCLADMPALRPADYAAVLEAAANASQILIPRVDGRRGNPVWLPGGMRDDVLAQGGGVRDFADRHPDRARFLELANPAYLRDIDDEADYQRLEGVVRGAKPVS